MEMHIITSGDFSKNIYKRQKLIEAFTLSPKQNINILVGIYEAVLPQPNFEVIFKPDMQHDVSVRVKKIEKEGEFEIVYMFQNSSTTSYEIKIYETYV